MSAADPVHSRAKRALDLAAAIAGIVVLAPVIALIAAVVAVRDGRPVLFVQDRPGLGGTSFPLYKFRTMHGPLGPDGLPLPETARLTPTGRRLRRWSLDELPQLWNILRGDLSLVGPRPLLMEYIPRMTPEQRRRMSVRPGLTGWVQVNGRNHLPWDEKFVYDLWYVDHWSFRLDLRILLRTVPIVLGGSGVQHSAAVSMPEFDPLAPPPEHDRPV